jgi:nucleotide-binding universal stress UspA family protein
MSGTRDRHQGAPRPDRLITGPDGLPVASAAVVIGLDGSGTSWDAFWWACGEARRLGGRAVAVFVSPIADASMAAMAAACAGVAICDYATVDRAASEHAERLRGEVRRHTAGEGPEVAFVHAYGDPARELLWVAEAVGADLIVVGRSTKIRHQVAGSLGRCLIARRKAPVVVVVP